MKAAPGPWRYYAGTCSVADAEGRSVCRVSRPYRTGPLYDKAGPPDPARVARAEANGRLLAAAPALREALKDLLEVIATDDLVPESVSYMRQARAALAAAEGWCDCVASGNAAKPKSHGADPHAKNCAVYTNEGEGR